jgi:hypothetical protein
VHTNESITRLHQEKSGHADYVFSGHDIDEIVGIKDADKSLRLIVKDSEPKSMLGVEIDQMGDQYVWRLKSSSSEVLKWAKLAAAKYRAVPQHNALIKLLKEADAVISQDRMSIVTVVDNSSTCDEAIASLSQKLEEESLK